MGIVITKYPGTFDTSKFDYSYDSDSFPTDAVADIDEILLEIGDSFMITQQTSTEDTMGNVETITDSTFRIYASLQDITKKDRVIQEMGLAIPGNRKLFTKEYYTITSAGIITKYYPHEGDIITDRSSKEWRIEKIMGERYVVNSMVFKVCIVKSINLEGSS